MHGAVPRLSVTPGILRRGAPRIGEDNRAILSALVGEDEFGRLHRAGAIQGESA